MPLQLAFCVSQQKSCDEITRKWHNATKTWLSQIPRRTTKLAHMDSQIYLKKEEAEEEESHGTSSPGSPQDSFDMDMCMSYTMPKLTTPTFPWKGHGCWKRLPMSAADLKVQLELDTLFFLSTQ